MGFRDDNRSFGGPREMFKVTCSDWPRDRSAIQA